MKAQSRVEILSVSNQPQLFVLVTPSIDRVCQISSNYIIGFLSLSAPVDLKSKEKKKNSSVEKVHISVHMVYVLCI